MKSDGERSWLANAGYDDASGSHYSYDSNVPNCQRVAVGDLVVIRHDDYLDGWGVIDQIRVEENADKEITRCPSCGKTRWRRRIHLVPAIKCDSCGAEFAESELKRTVSKVTKYEASYSSRWMEAVRPVTFRDPLLVTALVSSGSFNAIRPLDRRKLGPLLDHLSGRAVLLGDESTAAGMKIEGGHLLVSARRRRGQRAFRFRMMERFGEVCAFTGRQPPITLEAAHLYSYAIRPEHDDQGGLLLRRDCHSLFDAYLVTVNPGTWRIEVAPSLSRYAAYRAMSGRDLQVESKLRPDPALIEAHYIEAERRFFKLST